MTNAKPRPLLGLTIGHALDLCSRRLNRDTITE